MPFNVLLLPLLGGYLFISYWNRTRFDTRRYSGQRLLFHASIAGAVFLGIAYAVTRSVHLSRPEVYVAWRRVVPYPGTGTAVLAFLLAASTWKPLNWCFPREAQAKAVIERWGDFLEILLNTAMEETTQVAVTLASGKFYAGYVTAAFDPAYDRKYMRMLPTVSGYRDPTTKEVRLTTLYASYYDSLEEDDDALSERFQLIIPVASVVSANLFDPEVFDAFESVDDGADASEEPNGHRSAEGA